MSRLSSPSVLPGQISDLGKIRPLVLGNVLQATLQVGKLVGDLGVLSLVFFALGLFACLPIRKKTIVGNLFR